MISVKINISYTLKKNQFRNTRCKRAKFENVKFYKYLVHIKVAHYMLT